MAEIEDGFFRWWPVAVVIVQGAFGWVLFALRKQFVPRSECCESRAGCAVVCQELHKRVTGVETGISSLPTAEQWGSMQVAIEGLRGANKEVLAKIEGQTELLRRIERPLELLMQYHLKENK